MSYLLKYVLHLMAGKILRNSNADVAVDQYHRFEVMIDLVHG